MRTKFKELKAIFPLVNNIILNGCTCDVTLKLPNKNEYNNAYCNEDSISVANKLIETVFFPTYNYRVPILGHPLFLEVKKS